MAKKTENKRREYTKEDVKLLRGYSKARTPVARISRLMKRSEGSLRQKARVLGIGLGHQR
jgi:DNA-binding transcriptional MerR regulator